MPCSRATVLESPCRAGPADRARPPGGRGLLCEAGSGRGVRAAGAGRPEVPARPPARLAAPVRAAPGRDYSGAFWDNRHRRPSRHQQPSRGPLTRAPACLLPGSGVLRPDPDRASSSAFSGVNPTGRVIGWLRSQESCWEPAPENACSQDSQSDGTGSAGIGLVQLLVDSGHLLRCAPQLRPRSVVTGLRRRCGVPPFTASGVLKAVANATSLAAPSATPRPWMMLCVDGVRLSSRSLLGSCRSLNASSGARCSRCQTLPPCRPQRPTTGCPQPGPGTWSRSPTCDRETGQQETLSQPGGFYSISPGLTGDGSCRTPWGTIWVPSVRGIR